MEGAILIKTLEDVTSYDVLKQKVKKQEDAFFVTGELYDLVKDIKQSQLSENVQAGFELGSGGSGTILSRSVLRFLNLFEDDTEFENLKQDIAQVYTITYVGQGKAMLRLKQLAY